jgi:hypothetical protein
MAPEDESSLAVILFRVASVEESLREMRGEMRGGFAGLAFVSKDVYDSEKRSARDYMEETRKIAESGRTVAMATLSFVIVSVGMLLALIKAVAR